MAVLPLPAARLRGWRSAIVALLASLPLAAFGTAPVQADESAPVALTHAGAVRGVSGPNGASYLGIPYAAPPVGALRWKPPVPSASWKGVRDGSKPGNPCMQGDSRSPWGNLAGPGTPSEDCLYLNVHVPSKRPLKPRPVMVWIHGGGYTIGSGTFYDGGALAERGDVVVVTLNYRLGAFGFMAHQGLSGESRTGTSGNYGVLDQQAALRWVRHNIGAFGGNAGNVTVFGESAGGGSVCQNLISPAARGLFHRAIAQSGCAFPTATRETAETAGDRFATALGCTDVACLRGKTAADVLAAASVPTTARLPWAPIQDGVVIRDQVMDAFRTGNLPRIPVIQGSTHDEGRLTVATTYDLAGRRLTAEEYPAAVRRLYPSNADQVLARYPLSDYGTPAEALGAILTHSQFSCLSYASTSLLAQHTRVYAYEFNDPHAMDHLGLPLSFPLGAPHGSEIRYVFGNVTGTPAQNALSDRMLSDWARFARTGDPGWHRFPQVMDLAPDGVRPITTFPQDHECDLWTPSG